MLKDVEKLLKAAGDRARLRILALLDGGELCVCQLVAVLGLSQSTVSKHLSVLEHAGLVENERRGKWMFYRLGRPAAGRARRLLPLLRCCGEDDPQIAEDQARARGRKVRGLLACCPPRGGGKRGRP